jgi:hypothetical protein
MHAEASPGDGLLALGTRSRRRIRLLIGLLRMSSASSRYVLCLIGVRNNSGSKWCEDVETSQTASQVDAVHHVGALDQIRPEPLQCPTAVGPLVKGRCAESPGAQDAYVRTITGQRTC